MTRSLAPRRERPVKAALPNAVHHFRCDRCNRLIWSHSIVTECRNCMDHAVRVYGLGAMQGGVSGC